MATSGERREGTVAVRGLGEGALPSGDGATQRSSPFWLEEARLFAADNLLYDSFATAVDVWGDTAIVGARSDEHLGVASGSAYVFGLDGGVWTEGAKLVASGRADGDNFGRAVAIDGDTIAIGAPGAPGAPGGGAVVIFVRAGDAWVEQQTLVASDGAQGDSFGESVALSGDSIVVGAPEDDDAGFRSGAAYVFVRLAGVWTEEAKLLADDASQYDQLGMAVALAGDTVVVGAPEDHGTSGTLPGSAYVFVRSAGVWTLDATLLPTMRAPRDGFGRAVALGGDTIVVGAPWDKDAPVTGYAHVFVREAQAWVEQQRLAPADAGFRKRFGYAVDVLEDVALVGAPMDGESGPEAGAAYVFTRSGATWSQEQKLRPSDALPSDIFGATLALTPGRGIVGLHHEDHDLERAFVFRRALVGDACIDAASCVTGFCVDGVCCDEACGGGDDADCRACSLATGAAIDGRCAPTTGNPCDDGAFCNGVETCAAGVCASSGDPCSGPDGDADCAESCDEGADDCSADDGDGATCDDGIFCNGIDACAGGTCALSSGDPCDGPDGDASCGESCDEEARACTAADPDGSPCSDSSACTSVDVCRGGACVSSEPRRCVATGAACLLEPVCDPGDGECHEPAAPDGTACEGGTCLGGACVPSAGEGGGGGGGGAAGGATSGPGDTASGAGSGGGSVDAGGASGDAGGGTPSGAGGSSSALGAQAPAGADVSSGGCSCGLAPDHRGKGFSSLLIAAGALAYRRRRGQRRRRAARAAPTAASSSDGAHTSAATIASTMLPPREPGLAEA